MDRFELRRVRTEFDHRTAPVEILINGAPLLDTVRALERPQVAADLVAFPDENEDFLIAGKYMYPTLLCFEKESVPFFGLIETMFQLTSTDTEFGKVCVLGCDCGIAACWPFLVRIETEDSVVRWSDFAQFHCDWDYELGPFCFSRDAYEAELRRIAVTPSA